MELWKNLLNSKIALSSIVGAVTLAAVPLIAANAQSTTDTSMEVALPQSQIQFENINPAIKMATVYGDRGKGGGMSRPLLKM